MFDDFGPFVLMIIEARHDFVAARMAAEHRFEKLVDPDGVLPPEERAKRAENAKQAHMTRMALAAAKARRLRRQAAALDAGLADEDPDLVAEAQEAMRRAEEAIDRGDACMSVRRNTPGVGDRVRLERDEANYPSRGSWPQFRGRTGTVVEINRDRKHPERTEWGVAFGTVTRRTDGRGAFNNTGVVTWFKSYELVLVGREAAESHAERAGATPAVEAAPVTVPDSRNGPAVRNRAAALSHRPAGHHTRRRQAITNS
jgi:hypothetical protein